MRWRTFPPRLHHLLVSCMGEGEWYSVCIIIGESLVEDCNGCLLVLYVFLCCVCIF